jgi:hypothetical protein
MGAVHLTRRGRRAAERLMVDACEVRGLPTFGEMDPVTGLRPETPGTLVYAGKCKVQTFEAHESTPEAGDHVFTVQRTQVHLPADVEVAVDQIITVTASVLDANLVGRRFRVAAFLHKSFATANRVQVEEVTG